MMFSFRLGKFNAGKNVTVGFTVIKIVISITLVPEMAKLVGNSFFLFVG